MAAKLQGDYKFVRNENLDDYLKKMGAPLPARTMVKSTSPSVSIRTADGKHWEVSFKIMGKTMEVKFDVGVEFEDKNFMGRVTKNVAAVDGEELSITTKSEKGDQVRTFRLINGGQELEVEMKCAELGAEAKRIFKKAA